MKLLISSLLMCVPLSAGWYERKAEGWFYYEETPQNKEKTREEAPPLQTVPSASEQVAQMKKELEEKLAEAILEPTETNLRAYMELQKQLVAKAYKFSHQWTKTLLNYPDLDASLSGRPMSRYGIKLHDMNREENLKTLIQSLSKEHVVAFFYEGKSRISQAQSTIVTEYAKKRGFKILPLTMDSVPLENLPNSQSGITLAESLQITHFPALYLLNLETEEAIPIGFGLVTMDILDNNIELQFKEVNNEN